MNQLTGLIENKNVYWIELEYEGNLSLNKVPLFVDDILNKYLFSKTKPVILTSATFPQEIDSSKYIKLEERGNEAVIEEGSFFDNYLENIGVDECCSFKIGSPYDFNNIQILIPHKIAEAYKKDKCDSIEKADADSYYNKELIRQIQLHTKVTNGKALVLFSSIKKMHNAANKLRSYYDEKGMKLLVQSENLSRNEMIEIFKKDIDSVIFGVNSFWTGVDIPGQALSNVIITSLPFKYKDEHTKAKEININENSNVHNAFFYQYYLPEAILLFKQGGGRLKRKENDVGQIVILDHRIISKLEYKNAFINALPREPLYY